ncbi:SURF1 family cytochrome oxidase biogenesis protein [Nocardioides acrostichi]|uniref:SURF1-like protein n=1 Tax=Nocardioides acrostichi TaxID=2784339 RepID=A0A930V0X5_9ACTN|nr:SURF1 family protein [Nocardioides acrostichi]MBF4162014.1 SURF1 family protein [Nocardioides acrostichi]
MRSWAFLVSRRWILFAIIVAFLAYAAWWLGEWQFGRLADRKASNAIVRTNESLSPAPVGDVLAPDRPVSDDDEWRLVSATGTYDTADTVIVRYQTMDGASGVDVVVPLRTDAGPVLLVNRGWLATENAGTADPGDVPDPPSGTVTVTGYVRVDGSGDSTIVTDQSTRAVSSSAIGDALDLQTYGGFVDLESEDPTPATALEPVELPELDNGPHFFYGLQWWFFGLLAVFGFFYLAWDERRHGPRGERPDGGADGGPAKPTKEKRPRQSNHPYARAAASSETAESSRN